MRIIIINIKPIKTNRASNIWCKPKKTILQVVLNNIWMKYKYIVFKFLFLLCQKNQMAKVIIRYKVVQTGANIQSGGLKFGLTSWEYQGSLKLIVTKPPINEAENVIIKKSMNDKNLFLSI